MKRFFVSAATSAVIVVMVLATAPSAFAHATYKSSDPPDEGTVSSPPSEVYAEFTEPMNDGSYMDVTDPCGRDVGTTSTQTANEMTVQMNGVAAGVYSVFWRAVSVDGHITEGEFTFTSTGGDPCPGAEGPEENGSGGGVGGGGNPGSDRGAESDTGAAVAAGTDQGSSDGPSKNQHKKHGRGVKKRTRGGSGGPASGDKSVGQGGPGAPDTPSALDGIPVNGLVITLAISALIGAAAGKVYVSLSGDV